MAIPFYLAHPRLEQLERAQMLEVEGGTPEWCMKILRHEAGHAIDNAYKLRQRRRRQQLFGPSYMQYPDYYTPKPYSKSFVLHLDSWYAQSHPDEDFAETFAVWLNPHSDWRDALRRLAGAEEARIHGRADARARRQADASSARAARSSRCTALRKTLRAHYERKRRHYGVEHPHFYDRDLRKLFSDAPEHAANMKAARFIARVRRDVRRMVAAWTGEYQYTIDQVLENMIRRANELNLRLKAAEERSKLGLHGHADGADDELPAQRLPPRRALVSTEGLCPSDSPTRSLARRFDGALPPSLKLRRTSLGRRRVAARWLATFTK